MAESFVQTKYKDVGTIRIRDTEGINVSGKSVYYGVRMKPYCKLTKTSVRGY